MRKLLLACLALLGASPAFAAGYGSFAGDWVNQNLSTDNLTRVQIIVSGGGMSVHGWGKCHPTDCNWGVTEGTAYSAHPGGNAALDAEDVIAAFHTGFSEVTLQLHEHGPGALSYSLFTRFTDGSGRSAYVVRGVLRQTSGGAGPGPGSGGLSFGEDCVDFNPGTTSIAHRYGQWLVVDGSHQLLAFGDRFGSATRALGLIRSYHFTQHCFVSRPDARFDYWKTGGAIPTDGRSGEDCIGFNPDTAHAAYVGGEWKLVDGSMWLVSFGGREADAHHAEEVVHTYHLNRQCFVGRPNPGMTYWLAH